MSISITATCVALALGLPATARAGPPVGADDTLPPRARDALDRADERARRALAGRLAGLDAAFAARADAASRLADRALGWGGRRRWIADRLPGGGGHLEAFLRDDLDALLPGPGELEAMARGIVAGYLDDLRGIEGRLLVELRRDTPDLDLPPPAFDLDAAAALDVRARAAAGVIGGLVDDLVDDLARELVALIAGELAARAAVRSAASAGLRGAAIASASASLGLGLAAGVIVDQALGRAWDHLVDPRVALIRALHAWLDELRHLLVEGSAMAPGLRPTLERFAQDRSAERRDRVRRWVAAGGGGR